MLDIDTLFLVCGSLVIVCANKYLSVFDLFVLKEQLAFELLEDA